MTSQRPLKLGAFMRPISVHTGAWRYPGAFHDAHFNFAHLKRLALVSTAHPDAALNFGWAGLRVT